MPSISKKFGTGGDVNYTYGGKGQINKQRTRGGSIYGVQKNVPNINLDKYEGKKEGGKVATKKLFGGKETAAEELKEAKALKSGKISKSQYVAGEKSEGHGAGAAKTASAIKSGKITPSQYAKAETMMKKGGMTAGKAAHAVKEGKRVAKEMEYDYKTGKKSFAGSTAKKDAHAEKEGRKVAKAMEYDYSKGREMCGGGKVKKMATGGLAAGHKSADGIATKGKTKARAVTMKKGGKC